MSILASRAAEVEKAALLDWLESTGFNVVYGTIESDNVGSCVGWNVCEDADVSIAEAPTLIEALRKARQFVIDRETEL